MAYKSRVSDAVVRRLPMYYRHLRELEKAGVVRISSQELGERMNLTASQIRQDINCFGGFGQQGYGYHVANLKERIGEILGLNHEYHVIIIGAGNIGRAVANYTGFAKEGFNVQAMFDVSPALVGIDVHGILVQPMEKLDAWMENPQGRYRGAGRSGRYAQTTCDTLVRGGFARSGIFAPVDLVLPEGVAVNNVHLSDSLHPFVSHEREGAVFRH